MNAHFGKTKKRKKKMKLSILTPTIPSREKQVKILQQKIQRQIGDLPVEHLVFCDNKKRSIGEKRQSLVNIANGKYIAFVDDDDDICYGYVMEILKAAQSNPDVITFKQQAFYNEHESEIIFGINNQDQLFNPGGTTYRGPWHICAWKRETIADCQFAFTNYGEDKIWSLQARQKIKTGLHIDKILQIYRHSSLTTEAPESQY